MNIPAGRPEPATEPVMGLRDVFAAHIIAALIVLPKLAGVPRPERDAIAKQAYELADDLMRARAP